MQLKFTSLIKSLWNHITTRRRNQLVLLLVLLIFVSLAEIISIGAILPFLGALTAPEQIFSHPALQTSIKVFNFTDPEQLLFPLTILFAAAALVAGIMRLLLVWVSTRLNFAIGADLSSSLYERTLYQPYDIHVARNSSDVISVILEKNNLVIYEIINPLLILLNSSVLLIFILSVLVFIDPFIALSSFAGFGLVYLSIIWLTRNRLSRNGQAIARISPRIVKSVQEGLGGIRDVLLDNSQELYVNNFRVADRSKRQIEGNSAFISQSPRSSMEALGMILISIMALMMSRQSGGVDRIIPVLGAFALGAQRLLPVLQQAYYGWSNMENSRAALIDVLGYLDQPLPTYDAHLLTTPLPFQRDITLKDGSFRYSTHTPWVLKNVNLTITQGSCVGFIGATGSGKSTLLDIIMGLLKPTEGGLEIDGKVVTSSNRREWAAHIAHVPQDIFLSDATIVENIAIGVHKENIDLNKVQEAAHQAQISDVIESWEDQYQTIVGERGVRLSGGQRQRIGIARAIYKDTDVIILDEATSALDDVTENKVINAIGALANNLTILVVAHRATSLRHCSRIVEMKDGKILRIGSYQDIVAESGPTKEGGKNDKMAL